MSDGCPSGPLRHDHHGCTLCKRQRTWAADRIADLEARNERLVYRDNLVDALWGVMEQYFDLDIVVDVFEEARQVLATVGMALDDVDEFEDHTVATTDTVWVMDNGPHEEES